MAFALRLWAVPNPGHPGWALGPVDWLRRPAPAGDDLFREVHLNDGYQDFAVVLTADELRRWHERDRHHLAEPPYDHPGERASILEQVAKLEHVLAEEPVPRFFVAHWYEWESGLD